MIGLRKDWSLEVVPHYFTLEDYEGGVARWCPGCGDHGVLTSVQRICRDEQLLPEKTVCVSGIGCSSRFPHYMNTYGFHGLHGRPLPVACGIKSRRPDLNIWVATGDGDCCSIGAGHWIHAIRYNMNMVVMLFDNNIYGLTKMQTSPTTKPGSKTSTHPSGAWLPALNPVAATLGFSNVSFVATTIDWNPVHLHATLHAAYRHRGMSFVHIRQRCPHFMGDLFEEPQRDPSLVLMLKHDEGLEVDPALDRLFTNQATHDPSNLDEAMALARREDVIPIGLLFRDESRPCYEDFTTRGLGMAAEEKLSALEQELDRFAVEREKMPSDEKRTATVDLAPQATGAVGRATVLPHRGAELSVEAARALRAALWRFHLGEHGADDELDMPGEDLVPALLDRYRDHGLIRHDYPLFLFAADSNGADRVCLPLADMLAELIDGFAPAPGDARILKDNLARLERGVRSLVDGSETPADAADSIEAAGKAMNAELELAPAAAAQLAEDLDRLVIAIPGGGRLLALTEQAPIHLFVAAARRRAQARRAHLREEVRRLAGALRERLRLDRAKSPGGAGRDEMTASIGAAGAARVDTDALSRIVGATRGTAALGAEAKARLESVAKILADFLRRDEPPLAAVVSTGSADVAIEGVEHRRADDGGACGTAIRVFDEIASEWARVLGAVRAARLFVEGAYDPCRHDPLLDGFDWRSFTETELRMLPPVVAHEAADVVAESGMLDLSRVLRSGRPIQVIVPVSPAASPGTERETDPLAGFRMELAYLGISHREALVHQSSAARPDHLMDGYLAGLEASCASLHVLTSGLTADGGAPRLGAWMHAGVALEGRAHPFLHYNPEAGTTWARRIDFSGNPQPESDWPSYTLSCRNADGGDETIPLAITFADFALLEPRFRGHFRVLPDEADLEELVPIFAVLAQSSEEADDRLPFTWAADREGRLRRVLVSRALANACRDRLDFWRTLQELAGVRNEYVQEAAGRARQAAESEASAERERLVQSHAAALDEARRSAAQEAMKRLARALLDADASTLASFPTGLAAPPPAAVAAPAPAEAPAEATKAGEAGEEAAIEEKADEEEEEGPDEPWIDSVLCTSCNDCLDINRQLFVYNGNKQAVIGDPAAGTFAELVKAAEKCPARCIHPGRPLNPNEPGLDELVERAREFK